MTERPRTAILNDEGEPDSRPMNDEEYAQWQEEQTSAPEVPIQAPPPPRLVDVLAALDPLTATCADVINAARVSAKAV